MKPCSTCGKTKPLEDYHLHHVPARAALGERRKQCIWCAHDYSMRKRYGIGLADYERMLEAQGGVCRLCGKPERARYVRHGGDGERRLAVDHDRRCCPADRSCGKCVRGLLCYSCNVHVGWLENNVQMTDLVAYLGGMR